MQEPFALVDRFNCPCCGYPTLTEFNAYEICELCNWEDDGQGEAEAAEVWGGPNSDYSLLEARRNFEQYRVMYAPGRDQRLGDGDSTVKYEAKGHLIAAFKKLQLAQARDVPALQYEIERLEQVLRDETTRRVREYESKLSDGA